MLIFFQREVLNVFGKRLRELRHQKCYSMDKLVNLYNSKYDAKMNKSTLSRYENGLQDPIFTVVVNFANLFNVSIDYLSGGIDEEIVESYKKNDAITDIILRLRADADFLALVEKLNSLPADKLSAIRSLLT